MHFGADRKDPRIDDALVTINTITLGAIFVNLYYFITYSILQIQYSGIYYYNAVANIVFIFLLLFVFRLTSDRRPIAAAFALWILGHSMTTGVAILFFGPVPGFHYFVISFFPLTILIFSSTRHYRYAVLVNIGNLLGYIYCEYLLEQPFIQILDHNVNMRAQSIANDILTIAFIIVLMFRFLYNLNKAQDSLEIEHERANNLLLNILPAPIAKRLMKQEENIADGFADASVLFSDMVNFTELSEKIAPKELVTLLNTLFSDYDLLTEKYKIEKIKTIGDAYMVAAGVPVQCADHAERIADFALEMLDITRDVAEASGHNFSIRIGINSGTVVAGVIGTRKFIYDLWGDTVNVASRMESSGVTGEIQITESTRKLLGNKYEFESRGPVEIKGKGIINTFLLKRKL